MANVQNVVAIPVIPDQPKSISNQQIFVYTNKSDILNIISGAIIVGKAYCDSEGNNIANTFSGIRDGSITVGKASHADSATNDGAGNNIAATFENVMAQLLLKQNQSDPTIEFANNTVVGALNDLNGRVIGIRDRVILLETAASTYAAEIAKIKNGTTVVPNARNAVYDSSGNNIAEKFAGYADGSIKVKNAEHSDAADVATDDTDGNNIAATFITVKSQIAALQAIVGTGEVPIGTKTINYDPTLPQNASQLTADLNAFVQSKVGRPPHSNDSVIVVYEITGQTDRNFKYIYTISGWQGYEIPPIELADNGTAGLVSGTYDVGSSNNTIVSIVGGEIQNIYVKDGAEYRDIRDFLLANKLAIANIVDGTTVVKEAESATKDSNGDNIATKFAGIINGSTKVGAAANADAAEVATKDGAGNNIATQFSNIVDGTTRVGAAAYAAEALKATQDALGNNIVNTYLTQLAGATKQYVKDYALPKEFNDVLYLSANGFSEEIPTTPASGIQFTETSDAIGETVLATCEYTLGDLKFQLARKNSYTARYYIEASAGTNEVVQFKLSTYAVINNVATLLHTELTTPKIMPTTLTNFDFGEAFAELGNTVLEMEEGDKIRQVLSVVRENSTSVTFDVYSNATYPSSFYLNTTLEVGVKMVRRASQAFTLYSNGWSANANIAPYAYSADLQLPFSLDENSYVELIVDPIIAAKYGFVIGTAQNSTVTFYAIEEPSENISLKLIIDNLGTLNDLEDNYAFGYTFYLRNGEVEQNNSNVEVE